MCELLGVARSSYYLWVECQLSIERNSIETSSSLQHNIGVSNEYAIRK